MLAAEPLYLLLDVAVVGRLGAEALAGLAMGALVLSLVSTQLTFLSYGTTARAARMFGAGRRSDAVNEGVQATWMAVVIGVVLAAAVSAAADPLLSLLAGDGEIAADAARWLRIAILGTPLILITLAGNGWMRGVQDTMRPLRCVLAGLVVSAGLVPILVFGLLGAPEWGLAGSAVANLVGQVIAAVLFLAALFAERRRDGQGTSDESPGTRISLAPRWSIMRAQLTIGRDLVLRSLGFQAAFLSAAAVAARFGAPALAAHQVVLQLWNFVTLTLDSLAIAAQAMIGAALGAAQVMHARQLAWRITGWSLALATPLAVAVVLLAPVLPKVFTNDGSVLAEIGSVWWLFALLIPLGGIAFALDGVLLGSGDVAFLRSATLGSAILGFLPLSWLSLILDWGLTGIWWGLVLFMALRVVAVLWRTASGKWAVPGSVRV